jgi:hypothetical protein
MPAPKMRVEIFDNNGNRYTLTVEGQITRDKALQLYDVMGLLGGMPTETSVNSSNNVFQTELSRFEKVHMVIQKSFSLIWFTSKEIQAIYEQELKEPIGLSTVSTYLTRMTKKSLLIRVGTGNNVKYKTAPNSLQSVIKQQNNR